jgi:hypothetical protein
MQRLGFLSHVSAKQSCGDEHSGRQIKESAVQLEPDDDKRVVALNGLDGTPSIITFR